MNRFTDNRFLDYKELLSAAQWYADERSTCEKVKVGSVLITRRGSMYNGCNHGCGYDCRSQGCHRIAVYGEKAKKHRLPSDCMAIHSEIDAICEATHYGDCLEEAAIFVTRYPCEACARAIARSGIKKVVYGRKEKISEMTKSIFDSGGIEVIHVNDWEYEDNNL